MWLQTGAYHLAGLYWLIAVAVTFVIALVGLILASVALSRRAGGTVRTADLSAAAVVNPGADGNEPKPRTLEALNLLDGRYANGEITREQYLQIETDLVSASKRAAG
jgi:uncharacterized membrane protein